MAQAPGAMTVVNVYVDLQNASTLKDLITAVARPSRRRPRPSSRKQRVPKVIQPPDRPKWFPRIIKPPMKREPFVIQNRPTRPVGNLWLANLPRGNRGGPWSLLEPITIGSLFHEELDAKIKKMQLELELLEETVKLPVQTIKDEVLEDQPDQPTQEIKHEVLEDQPAQEMKLEVLEDQPAQEMKLEVFDDQPDQLVLQDIKHEVSDDQPALQNINFIETGEFEDVPVEETDGELYELMLWEEIDGEIYENVLVEEMEDMD